MHGLSFPSFYRWVLAWPKLVSFSRPPTPRSFRSRRSNRACFLPQASVVGGCLQHRPFHLTTTHTPTGGGHGAGVPRPQGGRRDGGPPSPGLAGKQEKTKAKGAGAGGGGGEPFHPYQGGGVGVPSPWSRAARTTGSVPPTSRPLSGHKKKKRRRLFFPCGLRFKNQRRGFRVVVARPFIDPCPEPHRRGYTVPSFLTAAKLTPAVGGASQWK